MGSCTSPQLAWYALRAEYASASARNDLQLTLQIWGVLAWIRVLETKTVNHGAIDAVGWKAAKVRPADDPSTALNEIMTRKK